MTSPSAHDSSFHGLSATAHRFGISSATEDVYDANVESVDALSLSALEYRMMKGVQSNLESICLYDEPSKHRAS